METMIVVKYENEYSAVDNMQTLRQLGDTWVVDIHDALAVARDADGNLHIQDSYKPTAGEGAGWGMLLGISLGGLALAPFTAGVSSAVAAGAVVAGVAGGAALGGLTGAVVADMDKEESGLSEDFADEVSDAILRGQSAIFALVEGHDPTRIAAYFRGTGGTIIQTNLSPAEEQRARQILAGGY